MALLLHQECDGLMVVMLMAMAMKGVTTTMQPRHHRETQLQQQTELQPPTLQR